MGKKADTLEKQPCPLCGKNTLTLRESHEEVPYFGPVFVFSMECSNCKYHKADVEGAEAKEPCKFEIETDSEKDMHIRVVKSSNATIKVPHIATVTPGPDSNGYVTNLEGVIRRIRDIIQGQKEARKINLSEKKQRECSKK